MSATERFSVVPLSPVSFIERAGVVFSDRVAVVDGERVITYRELLDRCRRWAGALHNHGIEEGQRVAVLAPNSHLLLEAHFGVALAGAVLVACNTRLAPAELAHVLNHSSARVLIADAQYESLAREAADGRTDVEVVVDGTFERWLEGATPLSIEIDDELAPMSINYTSGTTGDPKGVVYSHRATYLQAMAMAVHAQMDASSVYLWTLPMFHCNGWAFTWAVTGVGGTHICLREFDAETVWTLIRDQQVSHFCGAPTVLTMLGSANQSGTDAGQRVRAFVGGAPPTPALLESMDALGVHITHLYGLTESIGPSIVCDWWPEWETLPLANRAELQARQGVGNVAGTRVRVVDSNGEDVPANGTTLGEVCLRGNTMMAGYLDDPEATLGATIDGWFHTGDLAVMHPDGYIEIRDRAKDIIISGGENISSIEIERVLTRHPAVLEAAVVGVPNQKWGERPIAYVSLRQGMTASEDELRDHVGSVLARYKRPDAFLFGDLPKTSTGKIQKHTLREWAVE